MYFRPRVIPCLLLKNRALVKTVKFKNPNYLGDPINAVKIFNEEGVDELCILDINASKQRSGPDLELLKQIATEAFMPLSYGGGISTMDHVKELIHNGYEKVIINTAFISNLSFVSEIAAMIGSQSTVVSIDAKRTIWGSYTCYNRDGDENTGQDPVKLARRAEQNGAGEILLNAIHRDGTMEGYDLDLIKRVSESVSIPIITCGGARDPSDMKKALDNGAHAMAAGSMFVYFGSRKAVLINVPNENEFVRAGVYKDD